MNAMQTAVSVVTNLLAEGSFDVLEATTRGRRLSAADLKAVVETYGQTIVPVPLSSLESLDAVPVEGAEVPTLSVVVDLWTEEEGRSDLTLELLLEDRYGGAFEIQIVDLRVL